MTTSYAERRRLDDADARRLRKEALGGRNEGRCAVSPVDALGAALIRLQARMRALAWNSRASHAHHMEQMAHLRNEDGRAHAAWKEICQMRLAHWEAVQHG